MDPINHNITQTVRPEDPRWLFLAEFAFSEFIPDPAQGSEPSAGQLDQRLLEMGIPADTIANISTALAGYTLEAQERFKYKLSNLPGCVRVFYPQKINGDPKSGKTMGPGDAQQGIIPAETVHPTRKGLAGGWGYFAVERGGELARHPGQGAGRVVELYVYQEGS